MQACIVADAVQYICMPPAEPCAGAFASVSQYQKQVDKKTRCSDQLCMLLHWKQCGSPHKRLYRQTSQHLNGLEPQPSFMWHRNASSDIGS